MIPRQVSRALIVLGAIGASLYHFYIALVGVPEPMRARPVHVAIVLFLGFLMFPARSRKRGTGSAVAWHDVLLALAGVSGAVFVILDYERIVNRFPLLDALMAGDWIFGVLTIVLVLELTRRVVGITLPLLVLALLAYSLLGDLLPGALRHPHMAAGTLLDSLFLSPDAVYGSMTNLSQTVVFMFVAFGAIIEIGGGGTLLGELIKGMTYRLRGGPAKGAVVGSALFGTISGSGVANVFATGSVTIPLMKKAGFRPEFAAALEAVASQLGQLIPPVMGAAAFIVAEFSQVPFTTVALAAILPALLYVYAIYLAAHFETLRAGLGVFHDPEHPEPPRLGRTLLDYGHVLVPVVVLLYMLSQRVTPYYAATVATLTIFPISWLRAGTRMGWRQLLEAVVSAVQRVISVAVVLITAGILIGTLQLTGVPYSISGMIVDLGGGTFISVWMIVALMTIFLGMGMPVTGAFLIAALFGASALKQFGVPPFVAYMYIFMFALTANITPPVCIATFAAASIAETSFMRAGLLGVKIGLPSYIIPVMILYNPTLLFVFDRGIPFGLVSIVTALIGLTALVSAVFGWLLRSLSVVQRIVMFCAGLAFLWPGLVSDLLAAIGLGVVLVWQWLEVRPKLAADLKGGVD